jgi:hypothetical protein
LSTPLALVLALSAAVAGLSRNSWTAAGSDSYAYVSQADLWLHGTQTVRLPVAEVVPWPNALWTFTPHGYRPAAVGSAVVPVTSPGLSLLMAAAKAVAGHCAMFWVGPIAGAALVWTTFLIGRRLHSDGVALGAAWLMATSPAFLAMLVSPMSDVPAAALWAAAIYFTLGPSRGSAIAAGLAASAAILIRANLAPLAAVLFVGRIVVFRRSTPAHVLNDSAYFVAGVLPGCLLIAWLNNSLYGSPLASGYGELSSLFALHNVPANLRRYTEWFVDSQTPFALLGVAAFFLLGDNGGFRRRGARPLRRLHPFRGMVVPAISPAGVAGNVRRHRGCASARPAYLARRRCGRADCDWHSRHSLRSGERCVPGRRR